MTDLIRVGIVGATVTQGGSGWGANAHVPALKALPGYELAAVCTAHEQTARESAAAFGARHAFHRFGDMTASREVDLIVVCVRVPGHRALVMSGLQAGKAVFCEWPLGATLAEAQEMAGLARERSLKTIVGLQGRSDPAILYARDLVRAGHIGQVLTASLTTAVPAVLQRGPGRIWQGVRANGANTLTIAGGHAIDALCAVLGEFAEVSARVTTRIPEWRDLEGKAVPVDAPDSINVVGRMVSGAEVAVSVAAVPFHPSGNRIEIYGREGALIVRADGSLNIGPSAVHAAKGKEPMATLPIPAQYRVVPEKTPAGQAYNVAQAYARAADALRGAGSFDVDFDLAVKRHALIDAIERSSATGRAVTVA
ncbi:MAG TPA: Gfo/Idh/MocA family oxidoreductase [Methylomirabilota bacterium]|jgi:predicted dehydrogenase|nr:Gfo/Idh/MocA family oxidoreductase [Methylomirabilota bacterium]